MTTEKAKPLTTDELSNLCKSLHGVDNPTSIGARILATIDSAESRGKAAGIAEGAEKAARFVFGFLAEEGMGGTATKIDIELRAMATAALSPQPASVGTPGRVEASEHDPITITMPRSVAMAAHIACLDFTPRSGAQAQAAAAEIFYMAMCDDDEAALAAKVAARAAAVAQPPGLDAAHLRDIAVAAEDVARRPNSDGNCAVVPSWLGSVAWHFRQCADELEHLRSSPLPAVGEGWKVDAAFVPNDLRLDGWTVAVHNDYRQNGKRQTFWLLTKDGRCIKGEGPDDADALDQCRLAAGLKIAAAPLMQGEKS